jgi:DNA processing protein
MTGGITDDDRAAMVALAALPSVTPAGLRSAVAHHPPAEAWSMVQRGVEWRSRVVSERCEPAVWQRLVHEARSVEPGALLEACDRVAARVLVPGDPDFPLLLAHDIEPPAVLFVRGDIGVLARRRVGVVGTRNATAAGRATAFEIGEAMAASGVAVVSGLARGIDGAAHRGVRASGGAPVAVVGSGIDVPYPRQHRELWEWVATAGLLITEWPPGCEPQAWHFPLRNRILAALSEVVVVVESRERGGSLITAGLAHERGITVLAVPGSIHHRAASGTNQLIAGKEAGMVTSIDDIRVALALDTSRSGGDVPLAFDVTATSAPQTLEGRVFALCNDRARTLDDLASSLGVALAQAAMAAARLERDGWLVETGGWFEPVMSKFAGSETRRS